MHELAPCPKSPNCVCSCSDTEDKEHYIAPIEVRPSFSFSIVEEVLSKMKNNKISQKSDNYLKVVFTTPILRFKDDVEILYMKQENLLHIRSASRVGYSDFGTNRKRMNKFRQEIKATLR